MLAQCHASVTLLDVDSVIDEVIGFFYRQEANSLAHKETRMTMKKLLTVPEALAYQKEHYGYVAYSRDALYALAKAGTVPVVRPGKRHLYFPISTIERLMSGQVRQDN